MIRLLGVNLNDKRCAFLSLQKIYGIGKKNVLSIMKHFNWSLQTKIIDISPDILKHDLPQYITKNIVMFGNELRREVSANIDRKKRLKTIKTNIKN